MLLGKVIFPEWRLGGNTAGREKAAGPNPSSLPSIEVELEIPGEEVDPSKSEPSA